MEVEPSKKFTHFFILIGIGYYTRGKALINRDGTHSTLQSLQGAVPDVHAFQNYIQAHAELKHRSHIRLLTSTAPRAGSGATTPVEGQEDRPTRENIIRVFKQVTKDLEEAGGGIVHVHFSCHGLRVKTGYPDLRGDEGVDEAIVPYDARKTGQTLRDIELSLLISEMTKKGGHVSVVCDCCHAGDVTRGGDESFDEREGETDTDETGCEGVDRQESIQGGEETVNKNNGLGQVTCLPLPEDDTVLMKAFENVWKSDSRGFLHQGLQAVGYDLFSSCRVDQRSYETREENQYYGVYTHTLMGILRRQHISKQRVTHSQIHNLTLGMLAKREGNGLSDSQTPVFFGNGRRHFLHETESNDNDTSSLFIISRQKDGSLVLSGGALHGVTTGSTYSVCPWDEPDSDGIDPTGRPIVEIVKVRSDKSVAKCISGDLPRSDDELFGWKVVLLKYKLRNAQLRLCSSGNPRHDEMLKSLQDIVEDEETGILVSFVGNESTNEEKGMMTYHVGISSEGEYSLLDDGSRQPVPRFPTCDNPDVFFRHLKHVSRYDTLSDLGNPSRPDWLVGCVQVHIDNNNITSLCSWDGKLVKNQCIDLKPGDHIVRIRNTTKQPLTIVGFNFSPTWEVGMFYPTEVGEDYALLEAGQHKTTTIPVCGFPDGWDSRVDLIDGVKFFICTSNLNIQTLRSIEMESLSSGEKSPRDGSGLPELEAVLSGLSASDGRGFPRKAHSSFGKEKETWITIGFKLRTTGRGRSGS